MTTLRIAFGCLVAVTVAGCSQAAPLAPELGDCPADAGCGPALLEPQYGAVGAVSETTGANATSTTSTCGQLGFQSDTCAACMAQACCTENGACSTNDACLAHSICSSVCAPGDAACAASCSTENSAGAALFTAVTQCQQTSCSAECP